MNRAVGFRTLIDTYLNHQPVKDNRGTGAGGLISAPGDPRSDGTRQLYFAQQWGRNSIFINIDDRTYRDIRMKTASNADETGARADNPNRTIVGATLLAWLEQTLLAAQNAGTTWKFINISDPIDQIGPIGGDLTLVNAPTQSDYGMLGSITSLTTTAGSNNSKTVTVGSTVGLVAGQPVSGAGIPANTAVIGINTDGVTFTIDNFSMIPSGTMLTLSSAPSTYAPVTNDSGKSWMGGYRAERNALLKFIADHQITNVVFLATDDHQNRINELTYSPASQTAVQSTYVKVPYCFQIVCGPLGATGPDLISNHSFFLSQKLASSIANAQAAAGRDDRSRGVSRIEDVTRIGDPNAANNPTAVDFYSPDTFNYNKLDVSQDGATLSVTSYGINSTTTNSFLEYDAANNPEKAIFSFQVDAAVSVCHKRSTTLTLVSGSADLKRHLDHGDFMGSCFAAGGQSLDREK